MEKHSEPVSNRSSIETVKVDELALNKQAAPMRLDVDNVTLVGNPALSKTGATQDRWRAWSVVFGSFIIHCFVFGNEYIYGVYAEYYTTMFPNASSLSITFVGSLGSAMTYFVGMIAGVIADRWGYRTTGLIGSMLVAAGCVLASFATQVWHLYLTQGILFGIGSSLVYFPAVSAPTHWFPPHQRGLVVGISVSGVGVGGLFMAPLTQFMIERIGVAWALRVTGIVCFVLMGGACLLLREKRTKEVVDTEKKADERIEVQRKPKAGLAVFKELNMICMLVTEFASSFGYLVPFYFLSEYIVDLGYSPDDGAVLVGILSAAGCVGRITFGIIGDKIGHFNVLSLTMTVVALSVCLMWPFCTNLPVLVIFALVYGLTSGGYISTTPVVIADLYGPEQMATIIGWLFTCVGVGSLVGAPIAGAILDATRPHLTYIPLIEFSGATLVIAATSVIILRVKKAGLRWVRV